MMTCRQRTNVSVERERLGDIAEQMEPGNAGRLRIARNMASGEQRFYLRSEPEGPAVIGRVERLDAVEIARQEYAALYTIPNCKGEHAAETTDHVGAVTRVKM